MAMNPRLLRPRASGFNPRSVSGLEGWWDAADASSVTLDSGRVSTWADKSGKGRNATNSTSGSTQPDYILAARNGRNVLRFAAASNQRLATANATDFSFLHKAGQCSVYAVVRYGTSSSPGDVSHHFLATGRGASTSVGINLGYENRTAVSGASNGFFCAISNGSGLGSPPNAFSVLHFDRGTAGLPIVTAMNSRITPNEYAVFEHLLDPGNATTTLRARLGVNGGSPTGNTIEAATPSTGNSVDALGIGGQSTNLNMMTGDICEILIYSQHPTAAAQTAIRRYLAGKWGVTLA